MFSTLSSTVLVSRLAVRIRLTSRPCSHQSSNEDSNSKKLRSVSIGGLTKVIKKPNNPELVPIKYLPKDSEIPADTLKVRQIKVNKIDVKNQFFNYPILTKFLTLTPNVWPMTASINPPP